MQQDSRDQLHILLAKDPKFQQFSRPELDHDITYFFTKLADTLTFFVKLTETRKIAIIYLCFILGIHNFLQLREVINYLAHGEFTKAGNALLNIDLLGQARQYLTLLGVVIETDKLR